MKKISLFFLLISVIKYSNLSAQTYHPFVSNDKKWDYEDHHNNPCALGGASFYGYEFQMHGDTIIQGTLYKLLVRKEGFNCQFPCGSSSIENNYNYHLTIINAIREDSFKKIWCYYFEQQTDSLIYDFGIQIGDTITWTEYPYIVVGIDSIQLLNGEWRKRFMLTTNSVAGIKYWIEGIGSDENFFQAYFNYSSDVFLHPHLSCVLDSTIQYYEQHYSCATECNFIPGAQIVSVGENIRKQNTFLISNSLNEIDVSFNNSNKYKAKFKLINLNGILVFEKEIYSGQVLKISSDQLSPSVYFGEIIYADGSMEVKKFVKE